MLGRTRSVHTLEATYVLEEKIKSLMEIRINPFRTLDADDV